MRCIWVTFHDLISSVLGHTVDMHHLLQIDHATTTKWIARFLNFYAPGTVTYAQNSGLVDIPPDVM